MDHILNLLGNHEGGILLRYHFLRLLPDFVRSALSLSATTDLRKLAAEADRIFLAGRDQPVLSLEHSSNNPEVNRVHRRSKREDRRTSLCFYHARFGAKAQKCVSPCTWQGNGSSGQQQ
jgi:hypothetical protein